MHPLTELQNNLKTDTETTTKPTLREGCAMCTSTPTEIQKSFNKSVNLNINPLKVFLYETKTTTFGCVCNVQPWSICTANHNFR